MKTCPKCGNVQFQTTQTCYHDIIVIGDTEPNFERDLGCYDAEKPTQNYFVCVTEDCNFETDDWASLPDLEE